MTEIRAATIDEIVELAGRISEFEVPYPRSEYAERLHDRSWLGLVATDFDKPLGFKLGYALSEDIFYSWLGGVLDGARGRGIASQLMIAQESWAREQGFRLIRVKSRNRFASMVALLVRNGYMITRLDAHDDPLDHRIHFEKSI